MLIGNWININKRLPNKEKHYLVYGKVAQRDYSDWKSIYFDGNFFHDNYIERVTHWAEINPPKEKK